MKKLWSDKTWNIQFPSPGVLGCVSETLKFRESKKETVSNVADREGGGGQLAGDGVGWLGGDGVGWLGEGGD